jgi:hypothetical protein
MELDQGQIITEDRRCMELDQGQSNTEDHLGKCPPERPAKKKEYDIKTYFRRNRV